MKHNSLLGYHLLAFVTITIWGLTFVSSKILIAHGLTPAEIFFWRFLLAYFFMLLFTFRHRLLANNWKDEGLFCLLGLTGGSLYFLAENTALVIDLASNVSIVVCLAPFLTYLLFCAANRGKLFSKRQLTYAALAMLGVALVAFNGSFVLDISPLGSLLAFSAALLWAVYSYIMTLVDQRYDITYITRKVFFYGVLTILPVLCCRGFDGHWAIFSSRVVVGHLLFLGVVASLVCFWTWNLCLKALGGVRCTNYIYFNPIVTLVSAAVVLHEPITWLALLGCALILSALWFANRKKA